MRQTTNYGKNHAYFLVNDKLAEKIVMGFCDDFMVERKDDESFIFIAYHVSGEIVLLHFKCIDNETDFDSAIQLIKTDIQKGKLRANDKELKKALKDPHVTTARILLDYIKTEK